jgi:hypothetical protein
MWMRFRTRVWLLVASAVLFALVGAVASLPGCSAVGILLLPGALLAAIVFPQGPESDYALVFLGLAGLLDIILFALPIVWIWTLLGRRKKIKA